MGTNDTKGKLETIRQDFRAVGMVAKGLVAQVIFSSILPMRREDGRRRRWIFQVNNWLHCSYVGNSVWVSTTMGPCLKINN